MTITKDKVSIFFGFGLPLILMGTMGIYIGYRAFELFNIVDIMRDIKPGNLEAEIGFQRIKNEMKFHLLLLIIITIAITTMISLYLQNKENKSLISRVDWTVERLASLESKPPSKSTSSETKWPWGDHHTEALEHLDAAARRFWSDLYDPNDPSTAPTNEMVTDWLVKERGISKQRAAAIASLLRPDGLKTGPR